MKSVLLKSSYACEKAVREFGIEHPDIELESMQAAGFGPSGAFVSIPETAKELKGMWEQDLKNYEEKMNDWHYSQEDINKELNKLQKHHDKYANRESFRNRFEDWEQVFGKTLEEREVSEKESMLKDSLEELGIDPKGMDFSNLDLKDYTIEDIVEAAESLAKDIEKDRDGIEYER